MSRILITEDDQLGELIHVVKAAGANTCLSKANSSPRKVVNEVRKALIAEPPQYHSAPRTTGPVAFFHMADAGGTMPELNDDEWKGRRW